MKYNEGKYNSDIYNPPASAYTDDIIVVIPLTQIGAFGISFFGIGQFGIGNTDADEISPNYIFET